MKTASYHILISGLIILAQPIHSAFATVAITEFMANPTGTDSGGEFVELYNSGPDPIDLTDWIFSDEDTDTFTLPAVTLEANKFVILASDRAAFISDWNIPAPLQPFVIDTSFTLTNSTDELELEDSTPSLVWSLAYGSSNVADGESAYLDPTTPLTPATAFGSKAAPGVDLTMTSDYINQGVMQETEAIAQTRGIGSPFAWNGVSQIPEPSVGLLVLVSAGAFVFRRTRPGSSSTGRYCQS